MRRFVLANTLALVLVGGICSAARAERDHLTGYKVKDLDKVDPAGTYTMTNGYGTTSCELKKAKFFMVGSDKNAGDDPRGGAVGKYVCYKAKCDGALPPVAPLGDQFGGHNVETKKVQIVCTPAQAECESTVGGFCWFLGTPGQSCDTICNDNDRTYDAATDTYAGSTGSLANCQAVLNDMGVMGAPADTACGTGVGCNFTGFIVRCTSPATTSSATAPTAARVCACQ